MSTTFMKAPSSLLTSESVTEGHPDKLCDQIADAILDAIMAEDPMGRVACEVAATTGLIFIIGEITTKARVDYVKIARETIKEIGYHDAKHGIDWETCGVLLSVKKQSEDIAQTIGDAYEARVGELSEDHLDQLGAGDQGMMVGYACDETPECMPLTMSLAHRLCQRLAYARKMGLLPYLRPDGKSQVTVEYAFGAPRRVDTVVIAAQHDDGVSTETLQKDVMEHVIKAVIPHHLLDAGTRYYVNANGGRFVIGGPMGDAGMSGRKIIVDTYGSIARHGGGSFSGKDPTKVDRSSSYAARYVAKNVVAAGLAERIEVHLSYAIGVARPLSVAIETFGTAKVDEETILRLIHQNFDLRPAAIIQSMGLRRPIYKQTAAYGHFGRPDLDLPWEKTDKAAILRAEASLETTPERTSSHRP